MMNSKYLIDDLVLATMLKKSDPTQLVWKITFRVFFTAFYQGFRQNKRLNKNQMRANFNKAFASLIKNLTENPFVLKQTLFARLLEEESENKHSFSKENQVNIATPYLAGEILVQLIRAKDAQCFYHLFNQYKEPTMAILNHKYDRYFNVSPEEIYGEAMMILRSNIENGKLKSPMKSRLFTYFFLIARNKYLSLGNEMKGLTFFPDLMAFESKLNLTTQEPSFVYAFESLCPVLKGLLDNSKKEFFKSLINTFHRDEHELLRLRFEEGLRFREIGKRMHLKEATCRKRLHDSIKRWKKQYFIEQVA